MMSGKQKRAALKARKQARAERRGQAERLRAHDEAVLSRKLSMLDALRRGEALVDVSRLAPTNSYGAPEFVYRGTYIPVPFDCRDCGKAEIWTPTQQKWWYEVAKGDIYTQPLRCRPCRAKERARKIEARRAHLEGIAAKAMPRER